MEKNLEVVEEGKNEEGQTHENDQGLENMEIEVDHQAISSSDPLRSNTMEVERADEMIDDVYESDLDPWYEVEVEGNVNLTINLSYAEIGEIARNRREERQRSRTEDIDKEEH